MFYLNATEFSPKIVINFNEILFEMSGTSKLEDPNAFYQPVIEYVKTNFFEVQNSIHYSGEPRLTLHFYMKKVDPGDMEKIREIVEFIASIQEFRSGVYWYYNPNDENSTRQAQEVKQTFAAQVRLLENTGV